MQTYTDIFIDFDDTLYDTRGNAVIALGELYEYYHWEEFFSEPDIFYQAFWKYNVGLWEQYAKGEITKNELLIERFRKPLSVSDRMEQEELTDDFCLAVSDKYLELCATKTGVVEGAYRLMDFLRDKGFRLHLCSNGFREVQYKKLKASRLLPYFDTIILSEDAGANKPSPDFFAYAFRQTNANPAHTLMIGDNYYTDIEGGMAAGIDTLFFNPWDENFVPPRKPTYEVKTLDEIITRVQHANSKMLL